MSDGPHRSLPLRKPWKELAKRGDQSVYSDEQVAEAAADALASDFRSEVKWQLLDALKSIFTGRNNSLGIQEIALQELEEAKTLAAASVFGMSAINWSITLINEGRFGLDAFFDAIGLAAKQRGDANIRQVQEHYVRDSNPRRAANVGKRLQSAFSGFSERKLGSMLTALESAGARRSRKKIDLDEGVRLG